MMQGTYVTAVGLAAILFAAPALAQVSGTLQLTRATVVLEAPRGDSIPLGRLPAGTRVDVVDRQGNWLLVSPPAAAAATTDWDRGWIHVSATDASSLQEAPEERARPRGRLMIRGFGGTGGTLFSAQDSFDAIVGSQFGLMHGGGVQVVLPNGAFGQVSFERFRETGTRVLASGTQLFATDLPARVTVSPLLFSIGYRQPTTGAYVAYVGAGVGLHTLREEGLEGSSGSDAVDERKAGYHLFGGVEFPLARWVALAGEVGWATVPDSLSETGISAVYGEDDLGGTSVRLKVLVGF